MKHISNADELFVKSYNKITDALLGVYLSIAMISEFSDFKSTDSLINDFIDLSIVRPNMYKLATDMYRMLEPWDKKPTLSINGVKKFLSNLDSVDVDEETFLTIKNEIIRRTNLLNSKRNVLKQIRDSYCHLQTETPNITLPVSQILAMVNEVADIHVLCNILKRKTLKLAFWYSGQITHIGKMRLTTNGFDLPTFDRAIVFAQSMTINPPSADSLVRAFSPSSYNDV